DRIADPDCDGRPLGRYGDVELDHVGPLERGWVDDGPAAGREPGGYAAQDRPDQPRGDLLGFRVAADHLRDHLVMRAATDGVVRRVLDETSPGELQQAGRPGAPVQGCEGLGVTLESAFGAGCCSLEVDSRRDDVHQDVRAGAGAELTLPRRRITGRSRMECSVAVEVLGQCREPDLDVPAAGVDELDEVSEPR